LRSSSTSPAASTRGFGALGLLIFGTVPRQGQEDVVQSRASQSDIGDAYVLRVEGTHCVDQDRRASLNRC
jgi:hypothetical protein